MSAVTALISPWRPKIVNPTTCSAEVPVLVSLVRLHDRRDDGDRFACDGSDWALLLEVAVSFGWKQRGTTYMPHRFFVTSAGAASHMTRHNYDPGDARDPKCVDNIDAIAWAAALSTGYRSPYLPGMLAAHVAEPDWLGHRSTRGHDAPFNLIMKNFTRYAFGGAFAFSRAEQR